MKKTLHFFGAIALLFCVVAGPVVYAQLPTVTSVSPSIGYPASTVTITGTNFNTTTTNNIVFFGATQATVSSATTTSLVVTVPTGATYMPVSVDNMASHLTGFSNYPFLPDYNNNQYVPGVVNFDPYLDFTAGSSPEDVAIADIDGDGKPDLVVTNVSSNTISVYRNISTVGSITSGSFAAKVDFVTGTSPGYLVIGDIDGDGKPDIIVTNEGANTMSVFRNTSTTGSITTGSLAAKVDFATCGDPAYLAIGDIDGDGKPDIVVSSLLPGTDTFSIYHNTSTSGSITTGSFATRVNFTTGAGPQGVAIGDIDGDGKPDLAVCYGTSTVAVFRNIGTVGSITTGSFASGVSYSTSGSDPIFPLIEDMDGDGKPEMIVNNFSSSSVAVFHNTSTVGSITTGSFASPVNFATGTWPSTLAIGDIDGDGKPDIASNNQGSNSVSILHNISTTGSITTGSFAAHVDFSTATFPNSVAIGDLDGDGKPEIVASITTGFVTVLRNDPLGIIKGTLTICGAGSTTTLSDTTTGGTWSSSNTGVATVGSSTGVVTGVAGGTTTITYMLTSGTYTTAVVNVGAIITTIAGNGTSGYSGDGGLATAGLLSYPAGVAIDGSGNVYVADLNNNRVRKVSVAGIITTIAGNGTAGFSGDGFAATAAELNTPYAVAVDGSGNIYIADDFNFRIRKVSSAGIITTIAGNGTASFFGDGGPATAAELNGINQMAIDGSGNLFFADFFNNRIREINTSGTISTVAGNGTMGFSADGIQATASELSHPAGVAVDGSGNIFIADGTNNRIRKVNTSGIISTVAGTGAPGYSGDGLAATSAMLYTPSSIRVDASGNLYLTDQHNQRVRQVNVSGIISTLTGTGTAGYNGDNIAATSAEINVPYDLAIDGGGNLYIADNTNQRIRKVSTLSPTVAPITGTTNICPGTTSTLSDATTGGTWSSSNTAIVTVGSSTGIVTGVSDGSATITYLVNSSCSGSAPAYATTTVYVGVPIITTIAGISSTLGGYSGDGGPATAALLNEPWSVVKDATGNLYVADIANSVVRKISTSGIITTFAGTGVSGFSGDGAAATAAKIDPEGGVAVDASGNLYVGVYAAVRKINSLGIITTIAGNGVSTSYSGGGGAATAATIGNIDGIVLDAAGNIYMADVNNNRVYEINTSGIITTIAGTGGSGHTGDGTPATTAQIDEPSSLAIDGGGNLYIGEGYDTHGNTVRKVNTSGIISTIVGTGGVPGVSGDGGPATAALIDYARGLATDASGNLYIADYNNERIREVSTSGVITTVAGQSTSIVIGDGGPATAAYLNGPTGVFIDASGAMYIADFGLNSIRKVTSGVTPSPSAITGTFNVCPAATTALSDASPGGVWSSGSPGIATVGSTGIVTGVAAGVATISYTVTGGCGNAYATQVVTVNPAPNAGTITGTLNVCPAATTPLSDVAGGGLWSSVSPGIATVGSTGIVTGVAPGTDTIRYTSTTVCGTTAANQVVTVNPLPNAGSITGTFNVCPAATTTLSDAAGGGVWTSAIPATATVGSAGIVTGIAAGTTTISYTVTTACGIAAATQVVTVNPLPVAGIITGTVTVCALATTPLADAAGGGAWSSTATGIATVGTTGIVSGVAAGTATISYTVINGCGTAAATRIVTVNPLPVAGTITGTATVCALATTPLADGAGGGAWSSTATGVATVGTSGIVSGVSTGTATISYTVINGCGTAAATKIVTVNPLPVAGSITGTATLCQGATTPLTDGAGGGAWSSTATGTATVGTTGVVSGVAAGTATISYTVTNGCGTAAATQVVTVNATPGAISGAAFVCAGLTTTLTDGGTGTWTSSNTGQATVGSSSGVVTGIAAGTPTITYAFSTGCLTTIPVTVNATPGAISGTMVVCAGASTTLSVTGGGSGSWASSSTGLATVGSGTGVVTGIAAGTPTITYTTSAGCTTTTTVTVNLTPVAITGTPNVCQGLTTTLGDLTSGGTWSSGNMAIGTIDPGLGVVTGISAGTTAITYALSTGCMTTKTVTVNALPLGITGTTSVCQGLSTVLHDATGGGNWSSGATGVATIGSSTGTVTGISSGTAMITYTLFGTGCIASTSVTVNVQPAIITGTMNVCVAATTALSNTTTGGTWASGSTGIATIGSLSGMVTGVSTGTSVITYALNTGCLATTTITVDPLALVPSAIAGTITLCAGTTTALSDTIAGGTWSSVSPGIATIGSTGIVTGLSAGTTTISYTEASSCGSVAATKVVTINPAPNAGTISGVATLCAGANATLTDGATGGAWSSTSSGVATVGSVSGIVSAISAGIDTIKYTVTNGCGTAVAPAVMTIFPLPVAGVITGATNLCVGTSTTLTDPAPGGIWSSSNARATVAGGLVTGVSAGIDTIYYSVTGVCGTVSARNIMTVIAAPNAGTIAGSSNVCIGSVIALTDPAGGGLWGASNARAGVSAGVVSGVSAGVDTVFYAVANACGADTATKIVTVNPLPFAGAISGASSVCIGTAITLSDTASGGTWSSGSPAIATVGSLSGIVTGLSAGLVNISYSVTNLCGTARNISIISVSPLPNVGLISGPHNLCAGSTISLTDTVTGGSWSSSCACANVTGGVVNGVSAGTAVISYSITGSCGTAASATRTVTVNDLPTVFGVTGGGTECNGASYGFHVGLSTSIIGVNYQLYYNGAPLGSPLAGIYGPLDFGIQTGLGSYTVIAKNDSTGCANNMSGAAIIKLDTPLAPLVTVEAFPGTNLAVGQGATFEVVSYYSGAYPSYQWKINNTVVPGATSYIFFCTPFMLFNLDTVSCIVTIQGICGDISGIGSVGVTLYGVGVKPVTSNDMDLVLIPNPNNGQFTVKGTLDANNGEEVTLTITDLLGQQVYNDNVTAKGGLLNEQIQLNGTLANGMYLLNVRSGTENKVFHFVLKQ